MPGLGDLVTNFTSNTSGFDRGVKTTKSGIKSFEAVAKTSMAAVKAAFIGATAGLAAFAGAVYGLSGRISKLAGVADEAVKTGLSGAFLQRLGYAADQSGVDVATLTGGIKKLTIAIGKGDDKPFAALGLSLKELQAMSPEDQFSAVAGAIGKLPTAAERAAAAVKIFGKSGIEMTGLFAGGLNEVNRLMAEAKALGIGVSDEDLARAAAADDAIQRMYASFGALADKAAVTFAPAIESITNGITGWITPLNDFMTGFNALENKSQWLSDVMAAAWDVGLDSMKQAWDDSMNYMIESAGDMIKSVVWMEKNQVGRNPFGKPGDNGGGQMGLRRVNGPDAILGPQGRLDALMNQLKAPPAWQGPLQGGPAAKKNGTGNLAGLGANLADNFGPIVRGIQSGVMSKIDGLKRDASFLGQLGKAAFTGTAADKPKEFAPQLAGAMTKGSAGAYSTIVQAMTRRSDPQVKATEKSTKDIVKAIVAKPPAIFNLIAAFTP